MTLSNSAMPFLTGDMHSLITTDSLSLSLYIYIYIVIRIEYICRTCPPPPPLSVYPSPSIQLFLVSLHIHQPHWSGCPWTTGSNRFIEWSRHHSLLTDNTLKEDTQIIILQIIHIEIFHILNDKCGLWYLCIGCILCVANVWGGNPGVCTR